MVTKALWGLCTRWSTEAIDYLIAILGSIVTVPMDIVLAPFEIIALIIWKIKER